jgi:hypothetical protein
MSSKRNQSDSFRFKLAAFYLSLKCKVGLAAAKAAALRINLSSRVKQNKKAKNYAVFCFAGFFFLKFYVMK